MAEDRPACRRQAMDLLARREHSRTELERKLAARDYDADLVAAVLDELEDEGLLADDRFAESFIRARAARGQGPRRIRMELAQRGVDDGDTLLREAGLDWGRIAAEARIKRFGPTAPADYRERARQARFLEYRGFDSEQIGRALEFVGESD